MFLSSDITRFKHTVQWVVLFGSNIYLATLDDYFGMTSSENPLLHTWTFAIEMQFYLIIPLDKAVFLLQKKYTNFDIIDLSNSKAFENVPFSNDTIMYYDSGHLNRYGALKYEQYSGDEFIQKLRNIRNSNK